MRERFPRSIFPVMDALEFRALVGRLEQESAQNAAAYRQNVAGLAVLGYAYVFGMLIVLVVATIAVLAAILSTAVLALFQLLIALLVLIGAVVRALWVKMQPPDGIGLARESAPALFALIDRTARALRAPAVDAVVVDASLNAGMCRVGMGWR